MKKHPYHTPEADLLLLSSTDLLTESTGPDGGGSEPENPFWQGGGDGIVFPDLPLG